MMKKLSMKSTVLVGFFLLLGFSSFAQEKETINWLAFDEAAALTAKEPKMILVKVYTDWCGWCKKMDKETFTDAEVIDYVNSSFYAVKLNAEDTKKKFDFRGSQYSEADMAKTMQVTSFPNFVIIDAAMENITQLPGYRGPKPFLSSLTSLLENFNP